MRLYPSDNGEDRIRHYVLEYLQNSVMFHVQVLPEDVMLLVFPADTDGSALKLTWIQYQ